YGGDYDFYRAQKAIERQTEQEAYEENLAERQRLERLIGVKRDLINKASSERFNKIKHEDKRRFQAQKNAAQAGLGRTLKALTSRLDQLDDLERPELIKNYAVNLEGSNINGKLLLRTKELTKTYDSKVLTYPDFELRGHDRLLISGANGSGKTTLLKVITGLVEQTSGECTIGTNISYGYFSQDVSGLDDTLSGFENLAETGVNPTVIYREARSLGLDESSLQKKPGALSRGQQAKLSFAKLLLGNHQLLILDEPTNHLDVATQERIEAALTHYKGALLLASHDTYFVQSLGIDHTLSL
ncbi:MAG: ATP-binding cassette domain-containing protein, partial [Candidatus Saccharimonadales bacterium]